MLDSGLLEGVLLYINEDFTAVQFKLLGLLRMLCDGQGKLPTLLAFIDSPARQNFYFRIKSLK